MKWIEPLIVLIIERHIGQKAVETCPLQESNRLHRSKSAMVSRPNVQRHEWWKEDSLDEIVLPANKRHDKNNTDNEEAEDHGRAPSCGGGITNGKCNEGKPGGNEECTKPIDSLISIGGTIAIDD